MRLGISWLDFKLGFRMLVKYPGLTLVGGLSIAFAIAVGAATFEVAKQMLYPTLPLPGGDRVVGIMQWDVAGGGPDPASLHDFAAWREELGSVELLGAFRTIERNLITGKGVGEPVDVVAISASGFRVARVPPLLGRTLVEADQRSDAPPVVVIGYDVWQTRFAGDPSVVGRTVDLGKTMHTIVGVMPEGFHFPLAHSFWVPLRLNPLEYGPGEGPGLRVFGRLAPGVSLEEAQAELTTLGKRAAAEFPDTHEHLRPRLMPYAQMFVGAWSGEVAAMAYSANAFVFMFLVLVCANVATLVFARTATRESELVVRSALGASRGRIITQLFAEALVLGAVAAALGLAAADLGLQWGMGVFWEVQGGELPFWFEANLSPASVLYAGVLTTLVAVIAGVVPALKVTGRAVQPRLRQAGVGGSSMRFGKLWTAVIVTQVAFTVAFLPLLIDAGADTAAIEPPETGFPADEYLTVLLDMDRTTGPGASAESSEADFRARFRASYQQLERRLAAEPAVTGVTFASQLPGGHHARRLIEVEGLPVPTGRLHEREAQIASVASDFFNVMGASIVAGRGFLSGDVRSDARVVIVNRAFVDRFLDGRNAIGRRVRYLCSVDYCKTPGEQPGPWHEIIGVATGLTLSIDPDLPHNAGIYHPAAPGAAAPVRMAVHVRGHPESFAPRLRTIAAEVDPTLRLYDIQPLDEIQSDLRMTYTFWLRVAFVAGCIILLLSTVGIYSIMSFTVSRRTREIGIRLALGAERRRIVAAIFSRAAVQLGLGVLAGAALLTAAVGGIPSARVAGLILAGVAIVLGAGLIACIMPTRRALRIEPTEALRAE